MVDSNDTTRITGPHAWINWYAERSGEPRRREAHPEAFVIRPIWEEFGLSTDCELHGPWLTLGPYEFVMLDPTATVAIGHARRAVVLRAWDHIPDGPPSKDVDIRDDVSAFVGGDLGDELAALLGLALGRRFRSGGPLRQGIPGIDRPLGMPSEINYHEPALERPRRAPMLPGIADATSMSEARELLATYPSIAVADAVALVRAARQYVDGLWIADADPRVAWIKLVGALEAAASRRDDTRQSTPVEQLRRHRPGLYRKLRRGPPDALEAVAAQFARMFSAEGKVRSFVREFDSGPPVVRPQGSAWHFEWDQLEDALGVLYNHRSRDLHDGIAFPWPLCEPPHIAEDGVPPSVFRL